jgi:hypothetical protein
MKRWSSGLAAVAVVALAALLLFPQALVAQAFGDALHGRATDEQGGSLRGVTVTSKSESTGLTRTVTTGPDGNYGFASLPPGTYDVTAALSNFKTVSEKGVVINIATTRTLNFTMPVASASAIVTVTAEAPLVRADPAIGTVVSQQELQNLPLNGRQFANVAVLAPGTQLDYNSDPTKPGQLTIQMNGGSGRNVKFIVDGGDNNDDTIGGALQNFSLESVQEFKIQTQQYKAEYGRSTGGVLSVVTKSGTNEFHGSGFEYYRDKSLNSETESEKLSGSGKQDYRRDQYGLSIGGPIVRDVAHFFVSGERLDQKTNYTVNTDGVYPGLDGSSIATPLKDDLVSAKVSANVSASQFLQVRFGYQKNSQKYGASPVHTPDALGTIANKYSSILAGHQAQLSSKALNEFIFQYSKFDNSITADSNNPTLYFPSGVQSGQNLNTPQHTRQTKYHFKDDFSYSTQIGSGTHDFKFGLDFVHEPVLEGDFNGGVAAPIFTLYSDSVNSPVASIQQYGGFNGQKTPLNEYSAYLQDEWRPNGRVTVDVGLRYDLNLGYALNQSGNVLCTTLATQTKYNDASYYDRFRGWDCKLQNDHKNWAPRIGFSWDATGKGTTFVHGGWGIYYDFPYTNATILFPAGAAQSFFGTVYQVVDTSPGGTGITNPNGSLFHVGDPLPPNQLSGLASGAPVEVADPTVTKTPFTRQLSIGVSHQVSNWLGLSLEYSNVQYRDLPYRFHPNAYDPLGSGIPRFPDLGNFRLWNGGGYADYNGGNLGFNARVSDKFRLQGFYTLSRITGNTLLGADEFRLSHADHQPDLGGSGYGGRKDVSVNYLNPNCHDICSGPLFTDARHKVTFGAIYSAPYGITVSGVFRYRSALPFLEYNGQDLNGDGWTIDLDPGHHLNDARGHSFEQTDLSLSKDFTISGAVGVEVIAQVFNIFNATNPGHYIGNRNDKQGNPNPNFGTPSVYAGDPLQGEQRLLQFGARVHF